MADLLPCPFCGGKAEMGVNKDSTVREYFVGCMNCHIRLYKIGYKRFYTEAEAIAAWNTRAQTVFVMTFDEVRQMMKRDAERERTCHIEYPYYGDAPVINGQPRCSECKTEFALGTFSHYCPNCGAKVVKHETV